jgi:hypothetical protein
VKSASSSDATHLKQEIIMGEVHVQNCKSQIRSLEALETGKAERLQ